MSEENVEALRWLYGKWAKGDVWALREIADPNIEWEWSPGLASVTGGPRIYRGLDEIGAATLEFLGAWDRYWMTAEDFIDAGGGIVVVLMCLHAQAANTDAVIEQQAAGVWTLRDGKAMRVRYYDDRVEALEAAGLTKSWENKEVVRRWFELWSDWDWKAYEAIHDPHVVVIPPEGWPDGEVSIGRDAWIRQSLRLKESWETDRGELDNLREAGSHVIAETRWVTRGKDSGIEFETALYAVFTLLKGTVTRIEWFLDHAQALEAVGLSE